MQDIGLLSVFPCGKIVVLESELDFFVYEKHLLTSHVERNSAQNHNHNWLT